MDEALAWAAQLIEFGGALIVAAAVLRSAWALATRGIAAARAAVIGGTLGALGFETAATLLKALQLDSWRAIGAFAAIFCLRTVIKRLFAWEQARIAGGTGPVANAAIAKARNKIARGLS